MQSPSDERKKYMLRTKREREIYIYIFFFKK